MKHILTAMAALSASLAAHPAAAQLYFRADAGIGFAERINFSDTDPTSHNPTLGSNVRLFGDLGHSAHVDGGFGYRWNKILRTDLTLAYVAPMRFQGGDNSGLGLSGSAEYKALIGLANAYLDLDGLLPGRFGRFRPYLGGGLGIARNELGPFTISANGVNTSVSGQTRFDFAWSGIVGVGYVLSDHVTVGLEYKYYDVGELRTGTRATIAGVTTATSGIKGDTDIHTVNLGLRFEF